MILASILPVITVILTSFLAVIAVIFFVSFWDKIKVTDGDDDVAAEAASSPEEMP